MSDSSVIQEASYFPVQSGTSDAEAKQRSSAEPDDASSHLLNSQDPRPIHFIGIAGAGMRALAELFARRGVSVQGTDSNISATEDLTELGIFVSLPDEALVKKARAVVYSSAVPHTHPEMRAARALQIPVVRRAEALGIAVNEGTLVGVAGTHGKTTTTVMTTEALASADLDPTGIVGGRVPGWHGNLRMGGDTYVVEADEYDRSFLALHPTVAVVLNVEADHLDIYRSLDDILEAFSAYISSARIVVLCADDSGAMQVKVPQGAEVITYSAADNATHARLQSTNLVLDSMGSRFDVLFDGANIGKIVLPVPGLHNVRNALASIAAGLALGCTVTDMAKGLACFHGAERRFQRIGSADGVVVIDDYAHHPTEVRATLSAARHAFSSQRIVLAFQPHLYSRTQDLQIDFADALEGADALFLCDIYGAREAPIPGVTSQLIAQRLRQDLPLWQGPRQSVVESLAEFVRDGDVVITMGAGDITQVGPLLLKKLKEGQSEQ